MSCADANASWKKVKWASWGAKSAIGTGDLYQNDCQPNCVSGQFHSDRAKVVLSEVKATKKYGLLYSQATFSYSLKGKHMSETFGLATTIEQAVPTVIPRDAMARHRKIAECTRRDDGP
jgi:hypothetical protein